MNIRILIRDAPTILRDILEKAISDEPDMEVIREPATPISAPLDQEPPPDVVVVSMGDGAPAEGAREVLTRWPTSHVLLIAAGGQRVFGYELRPRGVDLGEMSPHQLVEAIRSATRGERKPYTH